MSSKELALEEQLANAPRMAERIQALNAMAWELRDLKPERALALAAEAKQWAAEEMQGEPRDPVGMAHSLIVLGFLDWRVSKLEQAVTRSLEAIHLLEQRGQLAWLPRAYNVAACAYNELGDRSAALGYLVNQLELSQVLQDRDQEATAYHDLGFFYQHGGESQKAIAYLDTALAIFRELDDTVGIVLASSNQHKAYMALGQHDQAFACAQRALQTAQALAYPIGELLGWNGLGSVYQVWGRFDEALDCYHKALTLARRSDDPMDVVRVLTKLGPLYTQMADPTAASSALTEALTASQQHHSPYFQRDVHQALTEFYKAAGDYQQALHHCEQYYQLVGSIFNEENERKVRSLEVLHRTAAAQRETELLRQKNRELEHEIAERQRTEQALIQTQKLESLRILAGGVAHDFNNLLTAMIAQSSLALVELPTQHRGRQHIDNALKSMHRAAGLAQQMLAYSGKGHFEVTVCDLNVALQADLALLRSVVSRAAIELTLADHPLLVEVDTSQLYQILMNLALNASEAGASKVAIQTQRRTITEADSHFWQYTGQTLAPGAYAAITVTDNGVGMNELTLARLFDPFYTTKFVGRGLGLAAVLGIIRGHRGGIAVHSQPRAGAMFTLLLPFTEKAFPDLAKPTADHEPALPIGFRTALIIDDEEVLRDALVEFFTMIGMEALTAADGNTGLEQFRQQQGQIDLVLLDVTMPGLNGLETLTQLRQINQTVPVIFSSGYTYQSDVRQFAQDQQLLFLPKPYSFDDLNRTMQTLHKAKVGASYR